VKQEELLNTKGRKKKRKKKPCTEEHDGGRVCFPKSPLVVMWTDASVERLVAAQ
jgi:hypothetical protein